MKKMLISMIAILLLIAVLFVLTGCDKEKEENEIIDPGVSVVEDIETLEYLDEASGNKVTFTYPATENFEITGTDDGGAFKSVNFKNEDLNIAVNMYFIREYGDSFERNKENNKATYESTYREYTANGYEGFSYMQSSGQSLHTKIQLVAPTEEVNEGLSLYMYIDTLTTEETDLTQTFYGETFQNFLNTLVYEQIAE